jgi:hypothetical protein
MLVKLTGEVISSRIRTYRGKDGAEKSVGETYLLCDGNDVPVKVAHPATFELTRGEIVEVETVVRPAKFGDGIDCWARGILNAAPA